MKSQNELTLDAQVSECFSDTPKRKSSLFFPTLLLSVTIPVYAGVKTVADLGTGKKSFWSTKIAQLIGNEETYMNKALEHYPSGSQENSHNHGSFPSNWETMSFKEQIDHLRKLNGEHYTPGDPLVDYLRNCP